MKVRFRGFGFRTKKRILRLFVVSGFGGFCFDTRVFFRRRIFWWIGRWVIVKVAFLSWVCFLCR